MSTRRENFQYGGTDKTWTTWRWFTYSYKVDFSRFRRHISAFSYLTFVTVGLWPTTAARSRLQPYYPTPRIPTNPGIAPRIPSKNNRSLAG